MATKHEDGSVTLTAYYWDCWEQRALAVGVEAELAQLGREVMRDHYQHGKEDHQLGEESDGDYMLDMCLRDPDAAKTRFQEDMYPWLDGTNESMREKIGG